MSDRGNSDCLTRAVVRPLTPIVSGTRHLRRNRPGPFCSFLAQLWLSTLRTKLTDTILTSIMVPSLSWIAFVRVIELYPVAIGRQGDVLLAYLWFVSLILDNHTAGMRDGRWISAFC